MAAPSCFFQPQPSWPSRPSRRASLLSTSSSSSSSSSSLCRSRLPVRVSCVRVRRPKAASSSSSSSSSSLASLASWAQNVGIKIPTSISLEGAPFDHGGVAIRGVQAQTPGVQTDEVIFSVPRRATLETHAAQKTCPRGNALLATSAWTALDWDARLATLLLHEKALGNASAFMPYMQSLPWDEIPPLLPTWSREDLDALNDKALADDATKERKRWDEQHSKLLSGLKQTQSSEEVAEKSPLAQNPPSLQEFVDTMCLVRSRAFSGPFEGSEFSERVRLTTLGWVLAAASYGIDPDNAPRAIGAAVSVMLFIYLKDLLTRRQFDGELRRFALCPAIDLLNRGDDDDADYGDSATAGGSLGGVAYGYFTDCFDVVASRDVAAGDEVTISYGSRSDADLLMRYGFVPSGSNPADWTRVQLGKPRSADGFGSPETPDDAKAVSAVARRRGGVDNVAAMANQLGGMDALRASMHNAAALVEAAPPREPTDAARASLAALYRSRRAATLRAVAESL